MPGTVAVCQPRSDVLRGSSLMVCTTSQGVVWVSDGFAEAIGRQPDQLVGLPIFELLDATDHDAWAELFDGSKSSNEPVDRLVVQLVGDTEPAARFELHRLRYVDDGANVMISLRHACPETEWVSDESFDNDVRAAMLSGAVYVAYQPIIDMRNGQLKKVEALARWDHPQRGPIGPDVFIPWAERTGVIAELGEWILDRACRDVVKMQAEGIEVDLSVNISVKQLQRADVSQRFIDVAARARLAPGRVWIEVTETILLDVDALAPLAAIRALGMRLAIDDFGTGHANYDYLTHLAVDSLKIDTSFVAGLGTKSAATAIVHSVVNLGRELGLEIVAEGVETKLQRAHLLELNCQLGQGWLFDRALRYDELVESYAPDETGPTAVVGEHRAGSDESVRLSALRACRILDTGPEAAFDSIVHLAAQLLSTPIAVIALADADRQWFKARMGTDLTETPRAGLCHSITAANPDEPVVIGDTTQHEHCALTSSVMGIPHARAYAAMPIRSREGLTLGTLSVVDTESRNFSTRELGQLAMLATQVSELLDLRRRTVELDDLYIGPHHNGRSAGSIPDDVRAHLLETPGIAALGHLTRAADHELAAAPPERSTCLRFDELVIDLAVRTINVRGQAIEPPAKEFDLLAFLATRPGEVFTRAELLDHVWNSKPEWQNPSTVTEHIHRLRTRIETDPNRPKLLRTVRGQGYSFQPASLSAAAPEGADARWGSWMHVDYRVVAADDGMVAMLGASRPADLIGRLITEFVSPASLPAVLAGREMRSAGLEPGPHVLTLCALDGAERLTLVHTDAGEFDGRPAVVGIAREIVDPRRLMRQMVSGVLTEVADAVVVTDPDLHVLSWNPAAARLYGWSEEEAVGFSLSALIGEETGFSDSATSGDPKLDGGWTGILRQRARDGTPVTVASSINVIRDGSDITGIALVNRHVPAELASAEADDDADVHATAVPAELRPGSDGPLEPSPDAALDALTRLAARLMETPLAAVVLIDGDRQWLASSAGVEMTGMRHDLSFSALAIAAPDDVFVVDDTELDERFAANPFVTGAPFIRSCAAVPLYSREGRLLGTLKVLDIRSRKFTDRQIRLLKVLALQIATLLDLRRRADEPDELIDAHARETPADEQLGFTLGELLVEPDRAPSTPFVRPRSLTQFPGRTEIDPDATVVQLAASRSLVRAEAVEEVVGVLINLVRDLGGSTIPARLDDGQALPLDCSFGHGEPLLARPDSMLARLRIERILPGVLDDAREVISRLRQRDDLADQSNTDFLTGLLNRRAVDQLLERLRPDDAVVVIDIDNFKTVNDRWGHAVGDEVLIAFARALRSNSRPGDQFGRLGGDELLAVLFRAEHTGLQSFLDRLRTTWVLVRPHDVTYSAGAALVGDRTGIDALAAADVELYSAKAGGRDQVVVAHA